MKKMMKKIRHIIICFSIICATLIISGCQNNTKNMTVLGSSYEMKFNASDGFLQYYSGDKQDSLLSPERAVSPWEIEYAHSDCIRKLSAEDALRLRHWKPDKNTIILEWDRFKGQEIKSLAVTAIVKADSGGAMSHWKISVDGIKGVQINKLKFPRISIDRTKQEEFLAVPEWMGQLLKNPRDYLKVLKSRKFEWSYPGPLSMQCLALYSDNNGFYAACDDTLAYRKNFALTLDSADNLLFEIVSFPPSDTSLNKYEPNYGFVSGSFKGDWITAAEIYREWGSRQSWSRESRFRNGKTPDWLENNALWVWNRGKSSNVLLPAEDIQRRLKLPVSVYWHWWHGCSYDDGFPEYIPPREGRKSFTAAMNKAHASGIKSIVYMNQALWGTTTESWKNENAEEYAARDQNGNLLTHVFNIFTGKPTAYMCMGTQFWKDKYSTLCDSAVNSYGADGVYMDMACLNTMCFNRSHGHPIGGGNYHLHNFGIMTDMIRSKIKNSEELVLAGEGAGEVWMPYLDLFLTLAVSKERYAGPGAWETIPFFQAVYHQYAITYGNYSSLLVPPYDELWPEKYAPKEPLKMLDRKFSRQFMMEQARSFVWGLQPVISNYQPFLASERKEETDYLLRLATVRDKCRQYLLGGKFMRSPAFNIPEEETDISRLSIYAGKMGESVTAFKGTYPLLYAGTWLSENNTLGIALASISDNDNEVDLNFEASEYGLKPEGSVYLTDSMGKTKLCLYSDGKISVKHTLKPRDLCVIEIIPN